jgi:hypothetical protein
MPTIPLLILFKAETGTQQISMAEYRTTYTTIASDTLSNRIETSITAAREHELKQQFNLKIWSNDNIYLYTNTNLQPYVSPEMRIIQYPTQSELGTIDNATRYCTQIIDLYRQGYAFVKTLVGENQTGFIQFQKITELKQPPDSSPQQTSRPPQTPARHLPTTTTPPFTREQLEELRRNVNRLVDFVNTIAE